MDGQANGKPRLLVIAAGGTGGHMFPAQSLAQEMLRRGWRVALSSDDRGLRYAGGFPEAVERHEVKAATFARGGLMGKAKAPFTILAGVSETIDWFKRERPAAVAGFGGYPSLPALGAAWRLGIPRLIHEQNGVLGRVNRIFATRVDALACGVQPVSNAPKGARLTFTGNPIRDDARKLASAAYAGPDAAGPLDLLVFGGSQGASVFAEQVPAALKLLPAAMRARLRLTQQVREAELAGVMETYRQAGIAAELAPFFDQMPRRIAEVHLVICRAGASTIAEVTAIGRPSILAPYPAAMDDHQTANARALVESGAAILMPDAQMTPQKLAETIGPLLLDANRLAYMARAAQHLGRPHAAEALGDLVEKIARK
ncbi:MAG: undecaprenyldiphospho-muramoylpentapeptide beta-N-acetylglucosaminyltransferase [Neomegalonema sp.]|nr:undecaprenyldiphospho-muramoylpentapeptide beta-N-acetylglucosaminyltransferase [Neomegalonema sp.]